MSYSREQRKWAAKRRAEFALKTALDRIDYFEDVVKPELDAIAEGRAVLRLPEDSAVAASDALAHFAQIERA